MPRRTVTTRELERPLTRYEDALRIVLAATPELRPRRLPTADAGGLPAAADATAPRDLPGFANSAMDGYAVRSSDLSGADTGTPVALPVVGSVLAGNLRPAGLAPGSCVEIGTGAPIPPGADAVVPFEETRKSGRKILFERRPDPGSHIRPPDDIVRKGRVLVNKGEILTPARIGLLAQCGLARISVAPRPKIAVVSTGDEIVEPGAPFQRGRVYDSNTYLISALCEATGCEVVSRAVLPDRRGAIYSAIRSAASSADLVIVSGGASVGPHDWAREAAGRVRVWRVALKPGKPFGYASGPGNTPVMLLPGNPGSAFAAFAAFGFDIISKLSGRYTHRRLRATLATPIIPDRKRILLRGVKLDTRMGAIRRTSAIPVVRLLAPMSSASLYQFKDADGVAFVPPGNRPRRSVEVLVFPWSRI